MWPPSWFSWPHSRKNTISSNMQMRGILQVPMVLAQPPQLPTMWLFRWRAVTGWNLGWMVILIPCRYIFYDQKKYHSTYANKYHLKHDHYKWKKHSISPSMFLQLIPSPAFCFDTAVGSIPSYCGMHGWNRMDCCILQSAKSHWLNKPLFLIKFVHSWYALM